MYTCMCVCIYVYIYISVYMHVSCMHVYGEKKKNVVQLHPQKLHRVMYFMYGSEIFVLKMADQTAGTCIETQI